MPVPARVYGKFKIPDAGLFLGSNPQPRERELCADELETSEKRRVLCRRYTNCVTHAAASGWASWTCVACPIEEDLSVEDQHHDLDGLAEFLKALNLK